MVQANCRARFTAADFDFIVRTLSRSRSDQVSLVDLLSNSETRDSILDHPRLVDAILCNAGHLHISSQFYFYVLARRVLQQADIDFYEQVGRTNYQLVAGHATARRCELTDIYEELANRFRDVRLALNQLSDRLLNLDDDPGPSLCLCMRRFLVRSKGFSNALTRRLGLISRIA